MIDGKTIKPPVPKDIRELQEFDKNCNDCKHMIRDTEKKKAWDHLYEGEPQFGRTNYGHCDKLDKPVEFIPGLCSPENADCFTHRKSQ